MEYRLAAGAAAPCPELIEQSLRTIDPAALVDRDPADGHYRIATSLGAPALLAQLAFAGLAVAAGDLRQLPSVCCGGCSG